VSGLWIMFFMGISQIPGDTLNAYTGMLAIASLGTNSKRFMAAQNRQAVRLAGIGFIFVVGTILACLSSAHFYSSFENFIGVLLFFFVPWSAINLVDYYLVKHGPLRRAVVLQAGRDIRRGSSGGRAFATSSPSRCRYRSLISCFYVGAAGQLAGRGGHLLDRRLRRGIAAIPGGGEALRPRPAGGGGRGGCGVLRFVRWRGELVAVAFDT